MRNKTKINNLLKVINTHIVTGQYLYSNHCLLRQVERKIIRQEILFVLKNGWHEKANDTYDQKKLLWKYAVRGRTIDNRDLRIIVSFNSAKMLIITVVNLDL